MRGKQFRQIRAEAKHQSSRGLGAGRGREVLKLWIFYHANGAAETNGSPPTPKKLQGGHPTRVTRFKTLRPTKGSSRSHVFGPKVKTGGKLASSGGESGRVFEEGTVWGRVTKTRHTV